MRQTGPAYALRAGVCPPLPAARKSMRLSIAGKIITFVVVAVALSCTAVLLTTMRLLEPPLDASIEGTTQLAKAATDATYNANSEKFLKEARLIAQNPELIEAVTRRDHAAAAAIERGNTQAAGRYLQMASHETLAYKNCRGAYELLCNNTYEGIRLLKAAKAEGSEEATYNLKIFFESNQTNIQ